MLFLTSLLDSQEAPASFFSCLDSFSLLFSSCGGSFHPRRPNDFLFAASITINPGLATSFLRHCESRVVTDDVKDDVCRLFVAPTLPKHGLALILTHRWSSEVVPPLHHHPHQRPPSHRPGSSSFSLMCCFVVPKRLRRNGGEGGVGGGVGVATEGGEVRRGALLCSGEADRRPDKWYAGL